MYIVEKFYPAGFDPQHYWDDKYSREHIAGKSGGEYAKQGFWLLLKQQLTKEGRYLDAGCGIGGWILFLTDEGYQVEGADSAASTIRALTEYNPDLKIKVGSLTKLPYPDAYFDGVLAIGSLEYMEREVLEALHELARILRPGGFVFLEVPLANTLRRWLYLPLKGVKRLIKISHGRQPSFANYLFTPQSLKALLAQAGFGVTAMQPHELPDRDSHYGLYIDWRWLRGRGPYKLNWVGRRVRTVCNAISPWVASTGMVVVARKK